MKVALLPDRGVVKITGEPARTFLNGLVTADMGLVTPDRAAFAALLTSQGKIVVDFFVVEVADGFLLDCPQPLAAALAQKLNFYKLRAKVANEDMSSSHGVLAIWDGPPATGGTATILADPRLPALGHRAILPRDRMSDTAASLGADLVEAGTYEAHRIALGVPSGGVDFAYGDAFPHEADMDQLGGVDFHKGCYVGQEVVSRIQHRASARTRVVPVAHEGAAPPPGTAVTAAGRSIGTFGSSANGRALALLRLDRVGEAIAAGEPLLAAETKLMPVKAAWARFAWPPAPTREPTD
jgi:tRNA-modifying protein YgfZ